MKLRKTTIKDLDAVFKLYKKVSLVPGGIVRLEHEISEDYISNFLKNTLDRGLGYVVEDDRQNLIAEIHAYSPNLFCFSHLLSELTIVVDSAQQTRGVGRMLFEKFIQSVELDKPEITRVELIARESNIKAIHLYESLGFTIEGKLRARIKNLDGSFEADVPMAWIRQ